MILSICVAFSTGCQPHYERELVGDWRTCDNLCTIMTIGADHTFSEKFEGEDSPAYSGVWNVDGHQLIVRANWANEMFREMVGSERRLIISEFRRNEFVTTLGEGKTKASRWKRFP